MISSLDSMGRERPFVMNSSPDSNGEYRFKASPRQSESPPSLKGQKRTPPEKKCRPRSSPSSKERSEQSEQSSGTFFRRGRTYTDSSMDGYLFNLFDDLSISDDFLFDDADLNPTAEPNEVILYDNAPRLPRRSSDPFHPTTTTKRTGACPITGEKKNAGGETRNRAPLRSKKPRKNKIEGMVLTCLINEDDDSDSDLTKPYDSADEQNPTISGEGSTAGTHSKRRSWPSEELLSYEFPRSNKTAPISGMVSDKVIRICDPLPVLVNPAQMPAHIIKATTQTNASKITKLETNNLEQDHGERRWSVERNGSGKIVDEMLNTPKRNNRQLVDCLSSSGETTDSVSHVGRIQSFPFSPHLTVAAIAMSTSSEEMSA